MAPTIIDWRKIVPARDFVFSMPKTRPDGDGTFVQLEVKDPESGKLVPFIHQTPKLFIPFGVEEKQNDLICKLTFPGVKYDFGKGDYTGEQDLIDYMHFLRSIDELLVSIAHEKSETWFKKKIGIETIKEFYSPILKDPKDLSQYAPHFKTKLVQTGKNITQYYNQFGETIERDTFKSNFACALMNTFGIWFAGKSFGMSFRNNQLAVFQEDKNFTSFAIDTGFNSAKRQRTEAEEETPQQEPTQAVESQ